MPPSHPLSSYSLNLPVSQPVASFRVRFSFFLLIHQLPPKPPQPPASKKRKRVSDDVPECKSLKPLLSGSIPVDQFVQTLEKVRSLGWQVGLSRRFLHISDVLLWLQREEKRFECSSKWRKSRSAPGCPCTSEQRELFPMELCPAMQGSCQ